MTIPNFVLVDQSFSKKTGQVPLALSNYNLPTTVTTGAYVADILNVRPGLVPTVEPFWNYTVGGSELSGWTLLVGAIPPTIPSTLRIIAGGQVARYALSPNVISVLGTLTLSGALNNGTSTSGSILGATPGSTIVSNVTGLTVNSALRTYSFNGSASASTVANGLVETLSGAIGSPKNNSITVLAALVTLGTLAFNSLPNPLYTGSSASGTITGAASGSTITASGLPSGFTINGGARTWAWSGVGTAATTSVSLTETLAGATNTPNVTTGLSLVVADPLAALTAPVLSNVSTGWATGQNPPKWQSLYTNPQGYNPLDGAGDQVRARWRFGAGAWTVTAWEPMDDELATGIAPPWPFLTDNSLNVGGAFEVQEQVVRDLGLGTEQMSSYSTSWSDTIAAVINPPTIVHLRTEEIDCGYGGGPAIPATAVTCLASDKILVTIVGHYNGSGGVTGVTANSGALTFTQIGTGTPLSDGRIQSFWCDVGAVTSLSLSIALVGSTDRVDIEINAVRGALAGAPAGSYFEVRNVTNEDPHDIDGNLNPAASGACVYTIASAGTIAFTGATALAAQVNNYYAIRSAYKLTTSGDVTIVGQGGSGPSYTQIYIANTKWSHA